ncbi:hypothetical protein EDD68_11074 [Melghiribacillus thermohalophilus]|uniref:Uncharacterized protein n=1 Tax=Melghiribacillus thermohalophilus TaxID=1324956 RepID=A0A4R3MYL7_9BACI|nr:hypothetical protein [Melghiribacillus thermohalophilus]TCT21770.1 hypothetical protein EDD68_11074 [Melghiribacillus thermohalophilus]
MVKLSLFEMKRTRRGYTATRRQHEEMLDVEIIMDEYDNLHPDGKYVHRKTSSIENTRDVSLL